MSLVMLPTREGLWPVPMSCLTFASMVEGIGGEERERGVSARSRKVDVGVLVRKRLDTAGLGKAAEKKTNKEPYCQQRLASNCFRWATV